MKKIILLILVIVLALSVEFTKADFTFGEPINLGPPINTSSNEATFCLSVDDLEMYISSNRPGTYGIGDIWVSTRATINDNWTEPVNLGPVVNSPFPDTVEYISPDGLELYFDALNRPGGKGGWDIWRTVRATKNDPWSEPTNLGTTFNTSAHDWKACISSDNLKFYFTSMRPGGYGGADIWAAGRATTEDSWEEPVNLGPLVNSSADDSGEFISGDGLTLFFHSMRSGGSGGHDLWMTKRRTINDDWNDAVNLGPTVNTASDDIMPAISADGSILYFCSPRPGGQGEWDIYQAPIIPIVDLNGDGIVDAADMCIVVDNWGTDNRLCDIGPMPWGDGVVDVEDLIVLAEYLFEEYPPAETGEVKSEWVLTWSDEFDDESIDLTKWTHMIGDGTDYGEQLGWGNNEKQLYTDDPANSGIIIDDEGNSVLFIEAITTNVGESEYTSAKLTTESLFTFRFGKVQARIKLPYSQGIWPAFWMLGSNKPEIGWPGCGEIDIMEMLGEAEETVYGNIHYVNSDHEHDEDLGFSILGEGKYSDDYHIYSMEWSPGNIKWLVDGEYFHEIEITTDMKEFLRSHFLILNIAVGGYWPGYPDETSVFPQRMYVDYIRIYQDTNLIDIPAEPVLDVEEETMGLGSTSALAAINSDFTPFHDIKIVKYGPASPDLSVSTVSIEGKTSILAVYSGGNWGGFWFELDSPIDMSEYHNGNLIVMLDVPENIADFEVKLESTGGFGSVNLLDYSSEPVDNNYDKFTIPLADFVALGLNLESLNIPFALWNPQDIEGEYTGGNVLVDNIYFELSD